MTSRARSSLSDPGDDLREQPRNAGSPDAVVVAGRHTITTWVILILTVIGSLNWALIGIAEMDLVAAIFGRMSPMARFTYILVGLSGIALLVIMATRLQTIRHTAPSPPQPSLPDSLN